MPWCLVLRCPCLVLSTTLLAVFCLIGLGVTSAPIVLNTDFETRRHQKRAVGAVGKKNMLPENVGFILLLYMVPKAVGLKEVKNNHGNYQKMWGLVGVFIASK